MTVRFVFSTWRESTPLQQGCCKTPYSRAEDPFSSAAYVREIIPSTLPHRRRPPPAAASSSDHSLFPISSALREMSAKKRKTPSKPKGPRMTLREESTGKSKVNAASMLRMRHLQNIATWASGDGSVPPLAALYGRRLASDATANGVALDRTLLFCRRCETILLPGDNCTIRIERNEAKARRRKKKNSTLVSKNNVTYTCHFCSHRNMRRGTSKYHVKEVAASRAKERPLPAHAIEPIFTRTGGDSTMETQVEIHVDGRGNVSTTSRVISGPNATDDVEGTVTGNEVLVKESPITPSGASSKKISGQDGSTPGGTSASVKGATSGNGGSRKRRRKGWTSLKDVVESSEHANKQSLSNLVIPFKL